jgi:hypothetical protein
MDDIELERKIVRLISDGVMRKRWIYWPPGPMVGQVFDKEAVEREVSKLIKEHKNG